MYTSIYIYTYTHTHIYIYISVCVSAQCILKTRETHLQDLGRGGGLAEVQGSIRSTCRIYRKSKMKFL